jgi:hypothetical protein
LHLLTLSNWRNFFDISLQEQGLGHDCELDDVRQPDPSTEPKRRGRPPKAVTQARQAAAAAAAAAAGEDDEEEGGSCMLAKGRRGSGRLQAVLAAAAVSDVLRVHCAVPCWEIGDSVDTHWFVGVLKCACDGDDADVEDDDDEGGSGRLGRGRRGGGRLQAVLAAAAVSD